MIKKQKELLLRTRMEIFLFMMFRKFKTMDII